MTQAMVHVDRGQTHMPLVCNVISVFVWTVCIAICFMAWLFATNGSAPQTNDSATKGSVVESKDRYASESRVRPGLRF